MHRKYGANINELIDRVNSLQAQVDAGFDETRAGARYNELINMPDANDFVIASFTVDMNNGDFVEYEATDERGSGATVLLRSVIGGVLSFRRDSTILDSRNVSGLDFNFIRGHRIIDKPSAGTYTYSIVLGNTIGAGALDLTINRASVSIKKFEG